MTLVELCVSLAIAAAMVTATLSATSAITRQDKVLGQMHEQLADKNMIRSAMAMDVLHAESFSEIESEETAPIGIEIQTSFSISKRDQSAKRTETNVRYQVLRIDDENWLCRIENYDKTKDKQNIRLVARGVDKLELQEDSKEDDDEGSSSMMKLDITINGKPDYLRLYTNN